MTAEGRDRSVRGSALATDRARGRGGAFWLAGVLALAVILTGCGTGAPSSTSPATSPAASAATLPTPAPKVTPLPDGVIAAVPLDIWVAPFGIVSDGQAIWVASHRGQELYRIDPQSNKIVKTIDVGQQASCGMPHVGFGRVWLPPCDDSTKVVVVDTTTNAVAGSIDGALDVALTADAVWAVRTIDGKSQVVKLDPKTLAPVSRPTPSILYDFLVVAAGGLWGISSSEGKIDALDQATGKVINSTTIPGADPDEALNPAVLDGAVWMKGYKSATLYKFDLKSRTFTLYQIPGYSQTDGYYDLAPVAAQGSLWLRISDTSVVQIDPSTGTVKATYPADTGGGAVAVDFGSVWIANFDRATVWRERIGG